MCRPCREVFPACGHRQMCGIYEICRDARNYENFGSVANVAAFLVAQDTCRWKRLFPKEVRSQGVCDECYYAGRGVKVFNYYHVELARHAIQQFNLHVERQVAAGRGSVCEMVLDSDCYVSCRPHEHDFYVPNWVIIDLENGGEILSRESQEVSLPFVYLHPILTFLASASKRRRRSPPHPTHARTVLVNSMSNP